MKDDIQMVPPHKLTVQQMRKSVDRWLTGDDVTLLRGKLNRLIELVHTGCTKVESDEDYTQAVKWWKEIKEARTGATDFFDQVKKPAHAIYKRISDFAGEVESRLRGEELRVGALIQMFQDARETERRAAEAQAQETANRAAELEQEAQARELEAQGAKGEAEEVRASPLPAPTVSVPTANFIPPTPGGPSRRQSWKGEITDIVAYLRAIAGFTCPKCGHIEPAGVPVQGAMGIKTASDGKTFDSVFINQQARALKGAMRYPGARAFDAGSLAASRKKQ